MSPSLYTIGYNKKGWTPEKILAVAIDFDAIVVDIRFRSVSRRSEWRYPNLKKLMGKRYYYWCPALGNRNYNNDGPIEIANPEKGLADIGYVFDKGVGVILMCACPTLATCHRLPVAQMIGKRLDVVWQEIKPPSNQLSLFS
jgi:hypothetical protein